VGTLHHGLFLSAKSPSILHGFSDADWAGNKDDRSSTSAYILFLGSHPISWSSKKQRVIAKSSTEAEYRALSMAASELCWVQNLLRELRVSTPQPPVLYCDNLGTTYVAAKPVFHSRMKHLEIYYHFVRTMVLDKQLRVAHVSSKDQLADVLTKPLSRHDFEQLRGKIGVSAPSPS
jgi:histone deacetylase 1/2